MRDGSLGGSGFLTAAAEQTEWVGGRTERSWVLTKESLKVESATCAAIAVRAA